MKGKCADINIIKNQIRCLQKIALRRGLQKNILNQLNYISNFNENARVKKSTIKIIILVISILILLLSLSNIFNTVLSSRCLVPLNYLMWEAARPLADCNYCANVSNPIVLHNVTRENFKKYAYTSKPIIVKSAIRHWKAMRDFDYNMFKRLYEDTAGSYETFEDGCQFLNFKSDLFTLKEVFNMPIERVRNKPGERPWYVGWSICHQLIKAKLRQYYNIPDFLPEDAEFPETENIFFGYQIGAVMHLDYIPRLMWQGQIKGSKIWVVAPVPECEHICHQFQYYVKQGDIVLLDTRVWYHATSIPMEQFSITVQSEYG